MSWPTSSLFAYAYLTALFILHFCAIKILTRDKLRLVHFFSPQIYSSSSRHWAVAASSIEWETSANCGWSPQSTHHQSSSLSDVVYHAGVFSSVWLHQRSWTWNSCKVYVHNGSWTFAADCNISCYDSTICEAVVCWSSISNTWSSSSLGTEILCSICFWSWCDP